METTQHQPGKLHRVLTLKDLIVYGIILIQPVAGLPLFGHADDISHGHAVTSVLIAMLKLVTTGYPGSS
jgi:putrescine importer